MNPRDTFKKLVNKNAISPKIMYPLEILFKKIGPPAPTVAIMFEIHFQIPILMKIVASHNDNLEPGEPQLNWCDASVMVSPVQLNSERKY